MGARAKQTRYRPRRDVASLWRHGGVVVLMLMLSGCERPPAPPAPSSAPAASVANRVKEEDLITITLTSEAETHLGIQTVPVEYQRVDRARTFGGEVVIPGDDHLPIPVAPLPSAAERLRLAEAFVVAEADLEHARQSVAAATVTFERARKVLSHEAGSARAADDARAQLEAARTALRAAETRKAFLERTLSGSGDRMWVRVPIYVGDLATVDTDRPARVGGLADAPGTPGLTARPVSAPPSADAAAATVDLFYAVDGDHTMLRAGQRVGVTLSLRGNEERLVVPWSAVLHDIYGGTWVYENIAPRVFARRRVQVGSVDGSFAALLTGPQPGARVVTAGAAELFGTEFGAGK